MNITEVYKTLIDNYGTDKVVSKLETVTDPEYEVPIEVTSFVFKVPNNSIIELCQGDYEKTISISIINDNNKIFIDSYASAEKALNIVEALYMN